MVKISLSTNELSAAVKNRIDGLLTRHKGKFWHYDMNNEMLHGSYRYEDKSGKSTPPSPWRQASSTRMC